MLGLGALLTSCGGVAGNEDGAAGSGSSEPRERHAVQSARPAEPEPGGSGLEEPERDPSGDEPSAPLSIPAPVTPVQTAPEPTPPPTGELDLPRPITPTPTDVVVPPDGCRFEYLGDWVRCENAGWPNTIRTDATDLVTCMQQCLEREDCTAVTDYLWLGLHELVPAELGCWLYVSSCDAPAFVSWGEEDAGREYRRACAPPTMAPPSLPSP